jgi:hypothetical protein
VRADLADVRLADRVFAPHYAEAVVRQLTTGATLRADRDPASEMVAELINGDEFELLDILGDAAWGIAPRHGLVGYIPAGALAACG